MTFDACLRRNPFPDSMIGPAARMTCQRGKFHGITARTVPIGRNET